MLLYHFVGKDDLVAAGVSNDRSVLEIRESLRRGRAEGTSVLQLWTATNAPSCCHRDRAVR